MNRDLLAQILERYRRGDTDLAEALAALKDFPSANLGGYAQLDTHRELRTGHPEVIYCAGKTPAQVRGIPERLLAAGAGDAWITPILMKKSRPAMTLSALCAPEREAALTEIFLRETTTLGLRRREVGKLTLERTTEEIATSFGPVRVKTGWLDGRRLKSKPEHDDLRRIATERGLPLLDVEHAVRLETARQASPP